MANCRCVIKAPNFVNFSFLCSAPCIWPFPWRALLLLHTLANQNWYREKVAVFLISVLFAEFHIPIPIDDSGVFNCTSMLVVLNFVFGSVVQMVRLSWANSGKSRDCTWSMSCRIQSPKQRHLTRSQLRRTSRYYTSTCDLCRGRKWRRCQVMRAVRKLTGPENGTCIPSTFEEVGFEEWLLDFLRALAAGTGAS